MDKELFTGCLPSEKDDRDYTICMAMEDSNIELPLNYEVWTPPLEDQGPTGNCVAQALAAIIECIYHLTTNEHDDYSVGYIYGNRKIKGDGYRTYSPGLYLRDAIKTIDKYGDIKRMTWDSNSEVPYIINEFQAIYDKVKGQAWFPISEYVLISHPIELKKFIYKYKIPVMVRIKTSLLGGGSGNHAVIVYGWSTYYFKIQNSWGDLQSRVELSYENFDEIWGLVPMEKKFTDVQDESEWYYNAIMAAANDNIINGYPDGSFKPDQPVTRAELAAIYQRMKNLFEQKS